MSIQSNINQTISIAGFLFQQGAGREIAKQREAKSQISTAKAAYEKELEAGTRAAYEAESRSWARRGNQGPFPSYEQWTSGEGGQHGITEETMGKVAKSPRVIEAFKLYEDAVRQYGSQVGTKEEQIDVLSELSREGWSRSSDISAVDYATTPTEVATSKAAENLRNEQDRMRGVSIDQAKPQDPRKIHRQSLREKGRLRADKKAGGGK